MNPTATTLKFITSLFGGVFGLAFNEIMPLVCVCYAFVLLDCYTAFKLSRRIKKSSGKSSGKFRSDKFKSTVLEMFFLVPICLLLAFFTQKYIFESDLKFPQIAAGIISGWQFWSILENESSCSDKKWAVILQKIMVDKAERHFDIDLSNLKKDKDETE